MSNFLPKTLLNWLICLLVLILIIGTVPYVILGYRFNSEITPIKIRNLINSLQNVGDSASLNANSYGEVATSTRDTLNKHVNPAIDNMATEVSLTMSKVRSEMRELKPVMISLTNNSKDLSSLIKRTSNRVNDDDGLLPTTTALIDSVRVLTEKELTQAVAELSLAGKNIRIITESPELQELPKEIAQIAQSLNRSAGSVEVILDSTKATSANLASITGNMDLISADLQKRTNALLFPKSGPWYKRYLLTPLKEIGGITYLIIRIINGT